MGFVSSHAWDAPAAAAYGFRVFWCTRAQQPAEYGLGRLATTMSGLADLPPLLAQTQTQAQPQAQAQA
jgi:2-haloacid dehalogenase